MHKDHSPAGKSEQSQEETLSFQQDQLASLQLTWCSISSPRPFIYFCKYQSNVLSEARQLVTFLLM